MAAARKSAARDTPASVPSRPRPVGRPRKIASAPTTETPAAETMTKRRARRTAELSKPTNTSVEPTENADKHDNPDD
jgi:hypothetical protein